MEKVSVRRKGYFGVGSGPTLKYDFAVVEHMIGHVKRFENIEKHIANTSPEYGELPPK